MEFRQEAGVMIRTNSKVRTSEQLAQYLLDPSARRYRQGDEEKRRQWLFRQIGACHVLVHTKPENIPTWDVLTIDTDTLDAAMMEDPVIANLTAVEIQDAFRAGVTGVYGEFYGISPKTLLGFLKSYVSSEKKIEAHRLISMNHEREDREAAERMRKAIQQLKDDGKFVPTWGPDYDFSGGKKKAEDSAEHRKIIEKQREEILKRYGTSH